MAFPNKTLVPIATDSRTNIDLSAQHVTSGDFLQFQVSKIIEMVPNSSISIDHECFTRLAPMPVPTFGRAEIVHRAFFVPMRTIFPSWNDFITDTPHYFSTSNTTQIVSQVLTMPNNMMLQAFLTSEFSTVVNPSAAYDFAIVDSSLPAAAPEATPTLVYYKLTDLGRFSYKLLRSLGITINWQALDDDPISLMPIFACIRVYYDFFYPAQYINDEDSAYMVALLTRDVDPSTFVMDVTGLQRIFKILSNIPYASDYFTSAWENPAGPTQNHYSDVNIPDTSCASGLAESGSSYGEDVETLHMGTPVIVSDNPISNISQYALNALRSLTDYMKRHQIAGSRALDRYLSRFGVKLASEKLNRCIMLHEYKQEIQFGDVMATASTDMGQLGDYAGKGLSYGNGSVNFSSDEYGYFIIVTSIVPHVQYYQGLHRMVKHISRLDFFTPEFDNLGTQAIAFKELYCRTSENASNLSSGQTVKDMVFGFTPRYAEYKVPYSQITGDLSLNSFKTSAQPWTLFRDVEPLVNDQVSAVSGLEVGINFIMATDRDQYGRIFYSDSKLADHFNMIHNFKLSCSFPGKSLFDDYEFEHEDKAQKVSVQVNGTTAQ